jgi:hypothetical protein
MSNQERIQRMAAERAAAGRERSEKAKQPDASQRAKRPGRSSTSATRHGRTRIVWAIRNHSGDIVKTFPYSEQEAAFSEAKRLSHEKGSAFYVNPHHVAMD